MLLTPTGPAPPEPSGVAASAAALAAAMVAGVLFGCTPGGLEATAAAGEKLSSAATAYVARPEDGRFGTRIYAGSGERVAALVAEALSPHLRTVAVAPEPTPAAASAARAGGYTYLVRPVILRWEDHPAAWSGSADRVRVLIEVIDATSGDAADIAVIDTGAAAASPAFDAGDAGDGPAAGLRAPLQAYVSRLLSHRVAAASQP